MNYFFFILTAIILPILLQVVLGYIVQKVAKLDVHTLSKIQFYYFIPVFMFYRLATFDIPADLLLKVITACAVLMAALFLLATGIAWASRLNRSMRKGFQNSLMFFNSGNICVPLIELLYTQPIAMVAQMCVLLFQNLTINSIGMFNSSTGRKGHLESLIHVFQMPMLYAVGLALAVNYMHIPIWGPLENAIKISSQGMVPLALFTLGAQLANTHIGKKLKLPVAASLLRLLVGPLVAWMIIRLTGWSGIPAQVFFICASAPTAVNTALLAVKFDNEPAFASQTVLISTLLSTVTLAASIYVAMTWI
ncbi:MAG TPA: AEC family transporter [Clostridiales bacterium]|nr:AEC family transporter [Clostridiales bacterium]